MDRPGSGDGVKTFDQVLVHYGVRGMKWGVKKRSNKPSTPTSDDSRRVSEIKNKARKGGTKTLSNKDLQEAINRMNLERQYKSLAPTKPQQVVKFVSDILTNVGKQQAIRVASDFATTKVNSALKDN